MIALLLTAWMLAPGDVTTPTPPPLPTYVVNDDGTRVTCAPGYVSCNWNTGATSDKG
jgi:hypothetical protein